MPQIFISYSRIDRPIVERLAALLADAGYDVWWDASLVGGSQFEKEIDAALNDAAAAIVVWSGNSVGSDWVRAEAAIAHRRKTAVPVVIDDLPPEKLPILYQQLHVIGLRGWRGDADHPGYRELLTAMSQRLGYTPVLEDAVVGSTRRTSPRRRWLLPGLATGVVLVAAIVGSLVVPQLLNPSPERPRYDAANGMICPAGQPEYYSSAAAFCVSSIWNGPSNANLSGDWTLMTSYDSSNWLYVVEADADEAMRRYQEGNVEFTTLHETKYLSHPPAGAPALDWTVRDGKLRYPSSGLETSFYLYSTTVKDKPLTFVYQVRYIDEPADRLATIDSVTAKV